jgi:hypothetical protein
VITFSQTTMSSATSTTEREPSFPPELERKLFETCALLHPETIHSLRPREAPAKGCPQKIPDLGLKNPMFRRRLGLKNPISDKGGHVRHQKMVFFRNFHEFSLPGIVRVYYSWVLYFFSLSNLYGKFLYLLGDWAGPCEGCPFDASMWCQHSVATILRLLEGIAPQVEEEVLHLGMSVNLSTLVST